MVVKKSITTNTIALGDAAVVKKVFLRPVIGQVKGTIKESGEVGIGIPSGASRNYYQRLSRYYHGLPRSQEFSNGLFC